MVSVPSTLLWPQAGYPMLGVSLLALVTWLLRYDVAMKTVRATGLPRFSAVCLLAGYAWLAVVIVANTVASLFYYLRWIRCALRPGGADEPKARQPDGAAIIALAGGAGIVILGVVAGGLWLAL